LEALINVCFVRRVLALKIKISRVTRAQDEKLEWSRLTDGTRHPGGDLGMHHGRQEEHEVMSHVGLFALSVLACFIFSVFNF
jgi:hypothetical protein